MNHTQAIYTSILIIALLLVISGASAQNIIINEFMSSNDNTIADMDGEYSDWIEIYNNTDFLINLENYSITDDLNEAEKWIFPSVEIASHDFLLIFASGKDIHDITELHTNFKIKQSGEELAIYNPNGETVSLIDSVPVPTDLSYGCIPNGSSEMFVLNMPSPNASNISNELITFSHPTGFYSEEFLLTLTPHNSNHEIHYTLNGKIPSIESPLYSSPLLIENNSASPNNFSNIPTTPLEGPPALDEYVWEEPNNVYKANTIRFASFYNGIIKSQVYSKTYFIDPEIQDRYSFPILSIITDSLNLFQYDTGIYIPGITYELEGFTWIPKGNYHKRGIEWERDIHISFLESNGTLGFETDAGMRMRGYASTIYPQKSFGVYFRNEYGAKNIEYPIFLDADTNKYKRLILRNSGQDFLKTHFRDAVLQEILKPMDLELQNFRPSIVFINGEYWGIHGIRQKYDEDYFRYNFDIDEDSIHILDWMGDAEEGNNTEYLELLDYLENNDLSLSENYDYAKGKIDISNFIDFQIAEIYYANYDWPCNNYKIWKPFDEDSKWRFLIYDLDFSFGHNWQSSYTRNFMLHATNEDDAWPHCPISNLIFRKLLDNDEFSQQFINQFAYHLNNTFEYHLVIDKIEEFKNLLLPEINEHIDRWNYPQEETWLDEINIMTDFARRRPCEMEDDIIAYFDLEEFEFECTPIQVDEIQNNNAFSVFPNPSNGMIKIVPKNENQSNGTYTIRNIHGQIMHKGLIQKSSLNIDLSGFPDGFYLINIDSFDKHYISKIVISK